jgi:rod shape-determining protein MreD
MTGEPDLWQRIETGLRSALPFALTLLLTVLSTVPLGPPRLGPVMPALPVVAVFYWAVYRPDLMPYSATFAIGVVYDSLTGAPMGLSSLVLLTLQGLAGTQRKFFHGKTLAVAWAGFALLAAAAALLAWLLAALYHLYAVPVRALLFQTALTVAVYPLVAWPFGMVLRELLHPVPVPGR